ncbi:hypothetical protein [Bradyrhizobium sp. 1(2017)]|uniref:hypothetical protein n=1 Tax=Bradyrhizobium sp. 1(2017) TaxID=1404888 RepID=UPI00140EEDEE|nr:hypothetical protein [Bradyrhizobium sp. 1(2017)]QIO33796.1 hypothetical protein HAP40_19320 [Bradyrhizobium sp. 1(2017)]
MPTNIRKDDIRDLLAVFSAAIELDQLRVDVLPAEAFHYHYSDNMWRIWRRCHLEYVSLLLSTVEEIRPATLEKLTRIATQYDPKVVGERLIDLFGSAASGSVPRANVATAALFFEWLITELQGQSEENSLGQDARTLMMRWLRFTDPLQIAEDPECGYKRFLAAYRAS